jgi:transcriptional regulator with XRE-family HTH domain
VILIVIKEQRLRLGLSQMQLAEKMDVKQSTVAMWENGKSLPRTEILIKLADLFGCTIDELVRGEKE